MQYRLQCPGPIECKNSRCQSTKSCFDQGNQKHGQIQMSIHSDQTPCSSGGNCFQDTNSGNPGKLPLVKQQGHPVSI